MQACKWLCPASKLGLLSITSCSTNRTAPAWQGTNSPVLTFLMSTLSLLMSDLSVHAKSSRWGCDSTLFVDCTPFAPPPHLPPPPPRPPCNPPHRCYHGEWLLGNACRACYLLMLFTPASLTAPFAAGLGIQRQRWLDLVVWTLERAGPAFIKWGQWAATRPDLFPPDLCTKLAQLQTGAPTHPFAYTRQAVESAFG